jgi:hypothetical protein
MAAQAISKPELALLQTVRSLAANPAAPMNIKKDPTTLMRMLQPDMQAPWQLRNADEVAGKAKPSRPAVNAGINKVRRFYEYTAGYCDETVENIGTSVCEADNATSENKGYLAVDIALGHAKSWVTGLNDFDNLLETPTQRRADTLRRAAYAILTEANKTVVTNLYSSISAYNDGTTAAKVLPIIKTNGDINPVAFSRIRKEYRKERFKGDFVVIGGDTVADYFDVRELRLSPEGKMGTMANLADMPMIYDSVFDEVFQEAAEDELSHGITVPVGSFFVDIWNEYRGDKQIANPDFLQTTIMIDGVMFDYTMNFDKCAAGGPAWQEKLELKYGLGWLPDSVYCSTRGLIKQWIFSCGDHDCEVLS